METKTTTHRERVRTGVREYIYSNPELLPDECWGVDDIETIIQTGIDILLTKWDLMHNASDFVNAICSNDLIGAVNRADFLHKQALIFYVMLFVNVGYIK